MSSHFHLLRMPAISDREPTLYHCDLILITSTSPYLQIRLHSEVLGITKSTYIFEGNTTQCVIGCKLEMCIFVIKTGKCNLNFQSVLQTQGYFIPSPKKSKRWRKLPVAFRQKERKKRINLKQREPCLLGVGATFGHT